MTRSKIVSRKQREANLRNARRSTGPRTDAGKAVSRYNALSHGILSRSLVPGFLESESPDEFRSLLVDLRVELDPGSALEELLVEQIAISYWRLARALRAETAASASESESRDEYQASTQAFFRILQAPRIGQTSPSLAARPDAADERAQRTAAIREAQGAIPSLANAERFARYIVTIERQIIRSLAQLERMQRLRGRLSRHSRACLDSDPGSE
jgi:hypothetical protein